MDKKRFQSLSMVAMLTCLPLASYAERVNEDPSAGKMMADLVIARPVGIGMFALGTVTFVATLPFSFLGGNMIEAADTLVMEPGKEAFIRCLGCTTAGRKEKLSN
jgi:hypothetical protein